MKTEQIVHKVGFYWYRYRFLIRYVLIGVIAIAVEIGVQYLLRSFGLREWAATSGGYVAGVLVAFFLNVKLNFDVPPAKFRKVFLLFAGISLFSLSVQKIVVGWMALDLASDAWTRLISAGLFFMMSYWLHRKFTFVDRKRVGVAVYANGTEPIDEIYEKVGYFPDFIHVDLVDETFGQSDCDVRVDRMEVVKAYWSHRPIHCHIMSRDLDNWVEKASRFSDVVFFHLEGLSGSEEVDRYSEVIRKGGAEPGIAIHEWQNIEERKDVISKFRHVLLLTIESPGSSGQVFQAEALEAIEKLDSFHNRSHFQICIDGGVNEVIAPGLPVENVVSGSSVLQNENPKSQIMRLQTDGSYDRLATE